MKKRPSTAREKLNKFYNEKNPSTGKPYIYTEEGNKIVTSMPSLADCRGQIVVMSCDDLQVGMHYGWSRDWNPKTIGGIHFATENHYEATKDDKVKYLDALIKGGSVGNQTFSDPAGGAAQQIPRSAEDTPLTRSIIASTGSNRPLAVTSSPNQSPKEIANAVMPKMYGDNGTLANVGTHYGWIMSDFVTNDTVKTFWKTNFPNDMAYVTITYTAPGEAGYEDQAFNVLLGSKITLPGNPFTREDKTLAARAERLSGNKPRIVGWNINGKECRPGAIVTISSDTTITAILSNQKGANDLLSSQDSASIKEEALAEDISTNAGEDGIAEAQSSANEATPRASGEEEQSNATTHTVTFVDEDPAGDEVIPESQMVKQGSLATRPTDPKREHAEFVGWYADLNVELSIMPCRPSCGEMPPHMTVVSFVHSWSSSGRPSGSKKNVIFLCVNSSSRIGSQLIPSASSSSTVLSTLSTLKARCLNPQASGYDGRLGGSCGANTSNSVKSSMRRSSFQSFFCGRQFSRITSKPSLFT